MVDLGNFEKIREISDSIYSNTRNIFKESDWIESYEKKIKDILNESIAQLTEYCNSNSLKIVQGILYINSLVIPHDGRIAIYFGNNWGSSRDERENNIRYENWINKHIFAKETDYKNILKIANEMDKPPEKFPILNFEKNTLKYPAIFIPRENIDIESDLFDKHPKELWKLIDLIFRKKKNKEIVDDFLEKCSKYYGIIFEQMEAKKFLLNPLRVAKKFNIPNLIYIYDKNRRDRPGGIIFGAKVNKEFSEGDFQRLLKNIQYFVSDSLLTPIMIAEAEYLKTKIEQVTDRPYVEKYFVVDRETDSYPLIRNLYNLHISDHTEEFGKISRVIHENLRKFFSLVTGPAGSAVRGFRTVSEKIFLCVTKIWDELEIEANSKKNSRAANSIEEYREKLKERKNSSDGPILLDLLFEALDFEDELKYLPSYREHFVHSFHAFCFGYWILSAQIKKKFVFLPDLEVGKRTDMLKSWFIVSMFHDIGYPISKSEESIEKLIKDFVGTNFEMKFNPSWVKFIEFDNFHKMLFGNEFEMIASKVLYDEVKDNYIDLVCLNNTIIKVLLRNQHHAIVSALLLYHHLEKKKSSYKKEKIIRDAIAPILMHHIYDKVFMKVIEDIMGQCNLRIRVDENALAYLLILVDTISQLDRNIEWRKEDNSKSVIIKLENLDIVTNDGEPYFEIRLAHDNISDGGVISLKKFYIEQQKLLNRDRGQEILKVHLDYNSINPEDKNVFISFKY